MYFWEKSILGQSSIRDKAWRCGNIQPEPAVRSDLMGRDKTVELYYQVLQCSFYCVGGGNLLKDVEERNDKV